MVLKEGLVGIVLIIALVLLTNFSASPVGDPAVEGAVAIAIEAEFEWMLGEKLYLASAANLPALTLCLDGHVKLDFNKLEKNLSDTILHPIDGKLCRLERDEGNFGMFTAMLSYFSPDGEEAGHREIISTNCAMANPCFVDIDGFGRGNRHFLQYSGREWRAVGSEMRWVV